MSKRLDILGARIFGASVCHARKYLQPFQKCPNVWTKSLNLAIMHKRKPHIIRIKTCICAFCYFINFLHTFLDIFILKLARDRFDVLSIHDIFDNLSITVKPTPESALPLHRPVPAEPFHFR